ncbi:small-conductance mechanosensitive channel [gamma proteobacterium NOR5-3]|nr:small-conductance mechanosensitive channel [gamma proteobacterium NOR5-3]
MESQLAVAFAHLANNLNLPWVWVAFGGLLLIALLGQWLIGAVFNRLQRLAQQSEQQWDDAFVNALVAPAKLAWWLLLLTLLFALLPVLASLRAMALATLHASLVLLVPWFLHRLIANLEEQILIARFADGTSVDKATVRATARLLRVALWLITALMLLQTLGVSVSGLLAFGGIGGIAVGFAAKDLLANFFGGLGIYMDRPFTIGDWVRSPDRALEGTVEDIGWRVTRIRTFDKRPLYVPNSVFAQIVIENPSRMLNRRIYEKFGLRYEDSRSLEPVVNAVREMLQTHADIDTDQTIIVNFESFGGSSLDCFLYCHTRTTNWVEYHGVKQDVLLKVLGIVHEHGADIAFPTRTLHVQGPDMSASA